MTDKLGGAELITWERARQQEIEGWSAAHDDIHDKGELLKAALSYAMYEIDNRGYANAAIDEWPWEPSSFKPTEDAIRNLVKAGALIAAEIDRLQRQQKSKLDFARRVQLYEEAKLDAQANLNL